MGVGDPWKSRKPNPSPCVREASLWLFSAEGQALATVGKDAVRKKIEQILKEKGFDVKAFQAALETGAAKKRVEEDMTAGKRIRVSGTPTKVVNGDIIVGSTPDSVLERYLKN